MENAEEKSVELVNTLDFAFSHKPEDRWKIEHYRKKAQELLSHMLQGKNPGLVADTGTGKTDITFLTIVPLILEKNFRALFLTPQRLLTKQQYRAFRKLTKSYGISASLITGKIPKKKREWKNRDIKIIFATPQTISEEMDFNDFDVYIFDEYHHATGQYTYVDVARRAWENKKRILGLSALPGDTAEKIADVNRKLHIDINVYFKIKMPARFQTIIEAKMDKKLREIDNLFVSLLQKTEEEMKNATIYVRKTSNRKKQRKWKPLSKKELDALSKQIDTWQGKYQEYFPAKSAIAKYHKLLHAYTVCMTDGYGTFQAYKQKLESQPARCSEEILNDAIFKEIVKRADGNDHPKALAYKNYIDDFPEGGISITFVGQKDTGRIIHKYLMKKGKNTEIVFGGNDKDEKTLDETIEKLRRRELNFVIATSVLHEGLHVPEINQVINYSIPKTTIARIQSKGRTARTEIGTVVNIILDHPFFDKGTYFATMKKEKKAKALIDPTPPLTRRERTEQPSLFQESDQQKAR